MQMFAKNQSNESNDKANATNVTIILMGTKEHKHYEPKDEANRG